MKIISQELIDYIFLLTNLEICIKINNNNYKGLYISDIILEKLCNWNTWSHAANTGNFELIKFLNGIKFNKNSYSNVNTALMNASAYGFIQIVKYLYENNEEFPNFCLVECLYSSIRNNSFETTKYLLENTKKFTEDKDLERIEYGVMTLKHNFKHINEILKLVRKYYKYSKKYYDERYGYSYYHYYE